MVGVDFNAPLDSVQVISEAVRVFHDRCDNEVGL